MEESTVNTDQSNDKINLQEQLNRIENENADQNQSKDSVKPENTTTFRAPDSLLDFLADKPIAIQKHFITKGLTPDQKKKVESVFQANEHELTVNRAAISELISDLCGKYPELTPYFSNKTIFLATFSFGYLERKALVESALSA